MQRVSRNQFAFALLLFAAAMLALPVGCNRPQADEPAAPAESSAPTTIPTETAAKIEPDPATMWKGAVEQMRAELKAKNWNGARKLLDELPSLMGDRQLTAAQQTERTELQAELDNRAKELAAERVKDQQLKREKQLAEAERQMNFGQFEDATKLLAAVLADAPSDADRAKSADLTTEIERRRRARRDLQAWMHLLASSDRREVETAQLQLLKDPDTALSMLAEATRQTDQPLLASHAVEALGMLDRPQQALPIMVELLRHDAQRELWALAVQEIVRLKKPGAGEALLELAVSDASDAQRQAALQALAQIVDPPARTLTALLPLVSVDGPLLPAALNALLHSIAAHGQTDWDARRGLGLEPAAPELAALAKFPPRLAELAASKESPPPATANLARALQIVLGQAAPLPLALKLQRAESELPEGPAAAAIDGVWASIEAKTMWRQAVTANPAELKSSLTLDLGEERTIAAVKLWNFNEPGAAFRGWREVEIFVGNSPSETDPVAKGILPQAPGAADSPDYGTLISVPFTRGRYVRLQAVNLWQHNSHTGLAELQVLGF